MLTLILASAGLAAAQTEDTAVVSSAVGAGANGSRDLSLHQLTGQELDQIPLRGGHPRPFEIRVTDSAADPSKPFAIDVTMNHLYQATGSGHDFARRIASSGITLGQSSSPVHVGGVSVDVAPSYLLSGEMSCKDAADAFSLNLTNVLTDPVCSLVSSLTGLLSTSLLTSTEKVTFSGVPVDGAVLTGLELSGLDPAELPLVLAAGGDVGAFLGPDCANGIGQGDAACAAGLPSVTARRVLTGVPATGVPSAALAQLESQLPDVPAVASATGEGALLSLADLAAVVDAAILEGTLTGAEADAGRALVETLQRGTYTSGQKVTFATNTIAAARQTLGIDDLVGISGIYRGFPTLTVAHAGAPGSGHYTGTITVRIIEGF